MLSEDGKGGRWIEGLWWWCLFIWLKKALHGLAKDHDNRVCVVDGVRNTIPSVVTSSRVCNWFAKYRGCVN
jgi:hypothetical protein